MTDEPSRDLDSQPDTEPEVGGNNTPSSRSRFGGITGRFRKQRGDQTPPPNLDLNDEMPAEDTEEWAVPIPAIRPPSLTEEIDLVSDPASAVSDSSDDLPEPVAPHPDLHPALRRDAMGDGTVNPRPEAQPPADQAPAEDDSNKVQDEQLPTTSGFPVIEERVAVTPRPVPSPVSTAPAASAENTPSIAGEEISSPATTSPDELNPSAIPALSRRPMGIPAHLTVLTGVAMAVVLAFILIEPTPRWFLILGAGAVVLGLDGTLRQTWREPFAFGQETAPFLFVPALFVLSIPVLIEHNFHGEIVILIGIGAGLAFGSLAWAELASVRSFGTEYPQARLLVTANTYLVGFAIYSLTYVFDLSLAPALVATGLATAMLAIEVLREGEIDPMETLGLSLVAGVVLAEARWLFYYMPLDTYLAGLALLLVFYFVTGLLHSYVIRVLNSGIALQYGGITVAGMSLVAVARMTGLA